MTGGLGARCEARRAGHRTGQCVLGSVWSVRFFSAPETWRSTVSALPGINRTIRAFPVPGRALTPCHPPGEAERERGSAPRPSLHSIPLSRWDCRHSQDDSTLLVMSRRLSSARTSRVFALERAPEGVRRKHKPIRGRRYVRSASVRVPHRSFGGDILRSAHRAPRFSRPLAHRCHGAHPQNQCCCCTQRTHPLSRPHSGGVYAEDPTRFSFLSRTLRIRAGSRPELSRSARKPQSGPLRRPAGL